MKHVLFVTYHFPPVGGVSVRRPLRLLRHLPDYGWRSTVLCADRPAHPHALRDRDELENLPPLEGVLRAPAHALGARAGFAAARAAAYLPRRRGLAARIGARAARVGDWSGEWLRFPDPYRGWVGAAVDAAERRMRVDPFDVVFATGPPWSALLAGERCARRLDLPLVADLARDWTTGAKPSGPRARRRERLLLQRATTVTAASEGLAARLLALRGDADEGRIRLLPHGYDPHETPPEDPDLESPDKLVLCATGTIGESRAAETLIRAVSRLRSEERELLRVRLVGSVAPYLRRRIRKALLSDTIELPGFVQHSRALQYQLSADIALLLVDDPHALPAQLAEYAGARRPVLALAPEGDASHWIRERGLGWVESPASPDRVRSRLVDLLTKHRDGLAATTTHEAPELQAATIAESLSQFLAG